LFLTCLFLELGDQAAGLLEPHGFQPAPSSPFTAQ